MTALLVAVIFAVALLGVLVAGLLRSHAEILRSLHQLGVGENSGSSQRIELRTRPGVAEPRPNATPASDIIGVTPAGASAKVGIIDTDHTTLLAFLSSGCLTCRGFWEAFDDPTLELPGYDTRLVIVTKGLDQESESQIRKLAPRSVPTIASNEAWDSYEVPVAPYFILVDGPSGTSLGEGAAGSWGQISTLLSQAVADAGMATTRRSAHRSGSERHQDADEHLFAAGIQPGHPSLYPETAADDPEDG